MKRRKSGKEFNQEAVQLTYEDGRTVDEVVQNLVIRPEILYRWRAEFCRTGDDAFPGRGKAAASEEEAQLLRREVTQERMERDTKN